MRKLALIVATALIVAACSSGDDTAGTSSDADDSAAPTTVAQAGASGSSFCREFQAVVDEIDKIDFFVEDFDEAAMYKQFIGSYEKLRDLGPSELDADFQIVLDALNEYASADSNATEPPLSDAESAEFDAAGERITVYAEDECGIDVGADDQAFEDDVEVGTDKGPENPIGSDAQYQANQTITLGGETYTESLSDMFDVSCDMYGDLETGSIGIYLSGPDFQSSINSYDTGVEPGTYEGRIWVFSVDPDLDEKTWGLQEIDGTFVLDRAQRMTDEEWLFEGSFSGTAENDPATSIEATFTCVGLVGF
ncbi:MAG: hypothetical protein M3094_07325 [Actinomycetia bacterium]|nr:hypothetical protein [Actinomycetes bacterium]